MKIILCIIYISSICMANFSVYLFGPISTPANAFIFIGLDFFIRDKLHERIGIMKMLTIIAAAGAISFSINPSTDMIAFASFSAFAISSFADAFVYQSLIGKTWLVKSNASNIVSSSVDSFVFPIIAFGGFFPLIVTGQFAAKVFGGVFWSFILKGWVK